jgi:flagellar protein FliS
MIGSAIARYQNVSITTGSPGELLLALYDGLFRFLRTGATALRAGKRCDANHAISRSHAILSELYASLDRRHAPALCENLERLYAFCLDSLVEANIKNDAETLERIVKVLTPVRDAFREAVAQVNGAPANTSVSR